MSEIHYRCYSRLRGERRSYWTPRPLVCAPDSRLLYWKSRLSCFSLDPILTTTFRDAMGAVPCDVYDCDESSSAIDMINRRRLFEAALPSPVRVIANETPSLAETPMPEDGWPPFDRLVIVDSDVAFDFDEFYFPWRHDEVGGCHYIDSPVFLRVGEWPTTSIEYAPTSGLVANIPRDSSDRAFIVAIEGLLARVHCSDCFGPEFHFEPISLGLPQVTTRPHL